MAASFDSRMPAAVPARADAGPRLHRSQVGDRVLLGISAVVDHPADPGVAQVTLVGELCPATVADVAMMFDSLVDDGIHRMHVDLDQLTFCTAAGVSLFEDVGNRLRDRGGALEIVNPRGVVRRVLDVTGLPYRDG